MKVGRIAGKLALVALVAARGGASAGRQLGNDCLGDPALYHRTRGGAFRPCSLALVVRSMEAEERRQPEGAADEALRLSRGCAALSAGLAGSSHVDRASVAHRAVAVVQTALRRFPDDQELQSRCCSALGNLTEHCLATREEVAEAGCQLPASFHTQSPPNADCVLGWLDDNGIALWCGACAFCCLLGCLAKRGDRRRARSLREPLDVENRQEAGQGARPGWKLADELRQTLCSTSPPPTPCDGERIVATTTGRVSIDAACSVCLECFADGESLIVLPDCKHKFHADCLSDWLEQNNSCPVCREVAVPGAAAPAERSRRRRGGERPESSASGLGAVFVGLAIVFALSVWVITEFPEGPQ